MKLLSFIARKNATPEIILNYFNTKLIEESGTFTFRYSFFKGTHSYNIFFQSSSSRPQLLVTRVSANIFDLQKQFIEDYSGAQRFLMAEDN